MGTEYKNQGRKVVLKLLFFLLWAVSLVIVEESPDSAFRFLIRVRWLIVCMKYKKNTLLKSAQKTK